MAIYPSASQVNVGTLCLGQEFENPGTYNARRLKITLSIELRFEEWPSE